MDCRKRPGENMDRCLPSSSVPDTSFKRKKHTSKLDYFYETLFIGEEDSDITIHALSKEWKLHKVFVKQSPYFSSMFSGSWKESSMTEIDIEIVDENITREALTFVFGSLYKEDLHKSLKAEQVVGVLAASKLFLLEDLSQQCCSFMVSSVSYSTVCSYYKAGVSYCQEEICNECMKLLTTSIMTTSEVTFLADISIDLMKKIVASPFLFAINYEFNVYLLLIRWLYMQGHPNWSGDRSSTERVANDWIMEKAKANSGKCFLETQDGKQFAPVFGQIRWQYMIDCLQYIDVIKNHRIVPLEWLQPVFIENWQSMLRFDSQLDYGPEELVSEHVFNKHCIRLGLILKTAEKSSWRLCGYYYKMDLGLAVNNRVLKFIGVNKQSMLKINTDAESKRHERHLCCRLTVTKTNDLGQEIVTSTTGIKKICIHHQVHVELMKLDDYMELPLLVSLNILLSSKAMQTTCPKFEDQRLSDKFNKDPLLNLNQTKVRPADDKAGTGGVKLDHIFSLLRRAR